jgi:hypothetical protein
MKTHMHSKRVVSVGVLALFVGLVGGPSAIASDGPQVIATGLNNPRQLSFSPGGTLYVAESGIFGTQNCQESPLGTSCLGLSGSVAKIGTSGQVTRVVTGLPSAGTATEVVGLSDLVFTGNHSFALIIGLGGSPDFRAGFGPDGALLGTLVTGDLRTLSDGSAEVTEIADLAAYEATANPDGADVDSNPVGLARWGNGYVVADAGGNAVNSTRKGGSTIAVLPPVPTTQPGPFGGFPPIGFPADAVPTDVVQGPDGAWYISHLVGFPFEAGSSTIWRVVNGSAPQPWATGLTNVTSLAFADDGSLYAVQISDTGLLAGPIGSLVKVVPGASHHATVAGGLFAPYGVAIRGSVAYVTTCSVCAGVGNVVQIPL